MVTEIVNSDGKGEYLSSEDNSLIEQREVESGNHVLEGGIQDCFLEKATTVVEHGVR